MINLQDVLQRVNTKDGLEFYGVKFNNRNFAACPFHNEKTPSFHYNSKTDMYKCFSCGSGGNIINFVMESFSISLPEALKKIDADFALGLNKELTSEEKEAFAKEKKIQDGLSDAEKHWKKSLNEKYDLWAGIYRRLFNEAPDSPLLLKLEEALDDFSGNILRMWPDVTELTPKEREKLLFFMEGKQ